VCEAVVDLLVAGGVPAVTVDAVVAHSGVAKTTVYRHWSTRDDLLADAAALALPEVEVPDTGSLAGDLRALSRGLAAALSQPRSGAVLAAVLLPGPESLDEVRRQFLRARQRVLRDVVRRAEGRGELTVRPDVDELVRTLVGALVHRRFVERHRISPALADRAADVALAGVSAA
jgi:AcrR family transcriptional regulator